jgi:hypothetical protein
MAHYETITLSNAQPSIEGPLLVTFASGPVMLKSQAAELLTIAAATGLYVQKGDTLERPNGTDVLVSGIRHPVPYGGI